MNFIDKWLRDRRIKAIQNKLYSMPTDNQFIITDRPVIFYPPVELTHVCDSLGILDIEA